MELNYSQIVQTVIREHAELHKSEDVAIETIFDTDRHHYLFVQVGWANGHWVYGCPIHLDWIDGKIYIQQNNTEISIAERLVQLGILKEKIFIGFHSPFKRKFTEYAVG